MNIKKSIFTLITATIFLSAMWSLSMLPRAHALNAATQSACTGAGDVSSGGGGCDPNASSSLSSIIITVVNILSIIVGVIAVIMLIIGGLRMATSNGDPQSVSGAKQAIIFALVGMTIAAMAQVIAHFVLSKVPS